MKLRLTTIVSCFLTISLVGMILLAPQSAASERVVLSQLLTITPIPTSSVTISPTPRPTYRSVFCSFLNWYQCRTPTPSPAQNSSNVEPTTTGVEGTPTIAPPATTGNTTIHVTLLLHGIGKAGDQKNPNGQGNPDPKSTSRTVSMIIFDENNTETAQAEGTVSFNATSGAYEGDIQTELEPGNYTATIDLENYPQEATQGIMNVPQGQQTVTLGTMEFVTGDINDDESVNILDYNVLEHCLTTPDSCESQASDLDSSGVIDLFDYNLFIRELSNYRSGAQL